jgi:hypothetical protein
MRALVWTMLGVGVTLASMAAHAQTYDPTYPVCLQTYGRDGNYISCGYLSIDQCKMTASGRAAQCITNPFFGPSGGGLRRKQRLH